ncbi:MAG: hypothetical protein U0V87_09625 [Acidobacteriota bacterium]
MSDENEEPILSALCQDVTRDGKTVQVEIIDSKEGGWILEIVDQYGNSTVWHDLFVTEQAALDEALKTIDEEGIDTLIGENLRGQIEPSE